MSRFRERARELLMPSGEGSLVAQAPPVPVREIFRRFWPDARPFRRWIPVGLVFIALGAALETAEIWIFKLVVDEVLVPGNLAPLVWIAVAYVAITLLDALISFRTTTSRRGLASASFSACGGGCSRTSSDCRSTCSTGAGSGT